MSLPVITKDDVAAVLGKPFEDTAYDCHGVSLSLVRNMPELKTGRVARGWAFGVTGQHSWVVLGDPYDSTATIVDATLWSYTDDVDGVVVLPGWSKRYTPHGARGHIFNKGMPHSSGGEIIELSEEGKEYLTPRAWDFLKMFGPLDFLGWHQLAHAPVKGWPAKEIISAMWLTPGLSALCPIDVVGMVTDLNPAESYW